MKDLAFTDVATQWDAWCRTDISDTDLIDGLIAGSHTLAAERDEARGQADLRLALIHTQARELAALRLKVVQRDIEIAEVRERLGRAEAAAEDPRWLPLGILIACCVALYVRLGV